MSVQTGRAFSTVELQAAADALLEGRFSRPDRDREFTRATRADDVHGSPADLGCLIRFRAACSGSGSSTMALALADALDAEGTPTRLVDAAAAPWSGALPATSTELGAESGWRRGRRGSALTIDRLDLDVDCISQVPFPRPAADLAITVLDTGWSQRELQAAPDHWASAAEASVEVVVGRISEQGLRQCEETLRHLDATHVVLVLRGHRRFTSRDLAAAGPRVAELYRQGRAVSAPLIPPRVFSGINALALPKQLRSAGEDLLSVVTDVAGPAMPRRP